MGKSVEGNSLVERIVETVKVLQEENKEIVQTRKRVNTVN